jgi:hypothetical protein
MGLGMPPELLSQRRQTGLNPAILRIALGTAFPFPAGAFYVSEPAEESAEPHACTRKIRVQG